jgi:hypothetical protein
MHVVRHQVAFQHTAFLLLGQTFEHFAQMLPQTFIQHLAAAFRDKCHMVFALPYRVA